MACKPAHSGRTLIKSKTNEVQIPMKLAIGKNQGQYHPQISLHFTKSQYRLTIKPKFLIVQIFYFLIKTMCQKGGPHLLKFSIFSEPIL